MSSSYNPLNWRRTNLSILDYFPYDEFRDLQREVLLQLQREWDKYDVFVIVAPTSAGKTALCTTIGRWAGEARITTPNNMLVKQYGAEYPDIPTIMGGDNYRGGFVPSLTKKMWERSDLQICNNHYHALYIKQNRWRHAPKVFIADEAHNLLKFQQDINSLTHWKHRNNFPYNKEDKNSLLKWLSSLKKKNAFHKALKHTLTSDNPEYILETDFSEWRGGGYTGDGKKIKRCSHPDEEGQWLPQMKLTPIDVSRMRGVLWPSKTQKIVLLSATIGKKDVEALGLGRKRVRYMECNHPIKYDRRPVINDWVTPVRHNNFEEATIEICNYLNDSGILEYHKGQKGLIHATYSQADIMKRHLKDSRFIFHTSENKREKYQEFMNSDPGEGKVLVASGMYEGLDLPDDLGRWQAITKVPWPSLGDPATKYKAERDSEWYEWQTLKDMIQACGRICRNPTDFGVSYILDGTFKGLKESELAPKWFRDALYDY